VPRKCGPLDNAALRTQASGMGDGARSSVCLAFVIAAAATAAAAAAQQMPAVATGIVEGRVLGQRGEPMSNVEVWAADWRTPERRIAQTRTDAEGMFVLGSVPLATSVFATAPGSTVGQASPSLAADQLRGAVQLRLWQANTLRGRVVDVDGRPVVDAAVLGTRDWVVNFRAPEIRTDATGRFELRGVPIGDCVMRAWAEGFVLREQALMALADAEVEVRLERGTGVRLVLRTEGLPADAFARTEVAIYATHDGSGFHLPAAIEYGRLDEHGGFRREGLPYADWNVSLSAPGWTFDPRSARTRVVHDLQFRATRDGSLQLHGTLRAASGEPLAGEQLICRTKRSQSMDGGPPGCGTTDAAGHFAMDAPLAAGEPYSLYLVGSKSVLQQQKVDRMTGLHDARYLVRYEDVADPARELTLVAVPAALVTAKLVDADGRPVPFQRTELKQRRVNRKPEWTAMASATSARDGSLVFPGVHGGMGELRVQSEGAGGAGNSDTFQLAVGERREITVRLQRAGVIEGRVLDRDGKPMPAARVNHDQLRRRNGSTDRRRPELGAVRSRRQVPLRRRVARRPPCRPGRRAGNDPRSDDSVRRRARRDRRAGRDRGPLIAPRACGPLDNAVLRTQASGMGDGARSCVCFGFVIAAAANAAAAAAQQVPAVTTGVVEGRVLGQRGEPVPNAEVWAAEWNTPMQRLVQTRTDAEGMFVLGSVPLQSLAVFAGAPGSTIARDQVTLSPDQPRAGVHLRQWQANTVRGRVVDPDGKPVPDAEVLGTNDWQWFSLSPETRTDSDGRFELRSVQIGACVLRAWKPGLRMREQQLTVLADTEVEVRLERGGGVQLSIHADGLPVEARSGTRVRLTPLRDGGSFHVPGTAERGVLDADGRWVLAGMPDVEWAVTLSAPGWSFAPRGVRSKAGELQRDLGFVATRVEPLRLHGTLRSVDGVPLAQQPLVCTSAAGTERAATDADGCFTLAAPLSPGQQYSLQLAGSSWVLLPAKRAGQAAAEDAWSQSRYQDVAAPDRVLGLQAEPAALVTARLVDDDGNPVPFQWTELQFQAAANHWPKWQQFAYATSRRDGALQFPGVHVPTVPVRLFCAGPGGAGESEPFTLAAGTRPDVVVHVRRPGVVEGRALGPNGAPLPAAHVCLCNSDPATGQQVDGSWQEVSCDRDGRFRFVGVAPGGHRLAIETADAGRTKHRLSDLFEVAPGATVAQDVTHDR
jgi:protocatechuate 3,4-dioxygenase beta subunit